MKIKTLLIVGLLFSAVNIFAQIPTGYYDAAAGLSGAALKTKLSQIISSGHIDRGYSGLWTAYQTTDIDQTFENDGSILDIYSENPSGTDPYKFTLITDQCGTYSVEGDCYNREHIVPQSLFDVDKSGDGDAPMVSDIHFIRATDGKVNGMRSNYPFGKVGTVSFTSRNGSKLGTSISPNYTGTVFEPIDAFKGDVARMIFYFVTRYESQLLTFSSGNIIGSNTFPGITDWELAVLLSWHSSDPVSQEEINRNNASYTFQGNRNPYIDHPEYVTSIWGSPTIDTEVPTNPSNLTIGTVTSNSIALSWTASTDNIGVSAYEIYMNSAFKTSVTGTSATISGLTPSTSYNFYIIAKDAAGNKSSASNTASGTTTASSGGGNLPGTELYISEYYEGLSNNKAIEITNPTSSTVSLSNYSIKKQANGAGSWVNELILSGNLSPNSTIALKNSSTVLSCTFTAQSVSGSPLDFNGNDPIGLFKSGTLIDIIGTFNNATIFAEDVNLRKKTNTPSTTFDITEWDSYTISSTSANCDNLGIVNPQPLATEQAIKKYFTIYPNPIKNGEIFFSGENLKAIKFLEIYSIEGKLMKKINNPFIKNTSIKVHELPKGVYFIKTDEKSEKIILQ
ncbi:endonuclease [Cloacibacterium sp. TD35]|uniref:endonuclease n=1 Tax=Cloacibacterium sp. TD35 TaxID=2976818 RepID=UPI00237EC36E|nr:endonuclease [Cloacibacterium sp. TD35]WDT66903.1 endonuclease [Cloacibacterium sp. TD35]